MKGSVRKMRVYGIWAKTIPSFAPPSSVSQGPHSRLVQPRATLERAQCKHIYPVSRCRMLASVPDQSNHNLGGPFCPGTSHRTGALTRTWCRGSSCDSDHPCRCPKVRECFHVRRGKLSCQATAPLPTAQLLRWGYPSGRGIPPFPHCLVLMWAAKTNYSLDGLNSIYFSQLVVRAWKYIKALTDLMSGEKLLSGLQTVAPCLTWQRKRSSLSDVLL